MTVVDCNMIICIQQQNDSKALCCMLLQTENFSANMLDVAKQRRADQGLTVAIHRDLADSLERVTREYKTDKKHVVSSLVEWFATQSPGIQRVILKLPTDGIEEAIALMLEAMARDVRDGKLSLSRQAAGQSADDLEVGDGVPPTKPVDESAPAAQKKSKHRDTKSGSAH